MIVAYSDPETSSIMGWFELNGERLTAEDLESLDLYIEDTLVDDQSYSEVETDSGMLTIFRTKMLNLCGCITVMQAAQHHSILFHSR